MKNLLIAFLIFFVGGFIVLNTVFAQEDIELSFYRLSIELQKAGVSPRDIKGVGKPVKSMLNNGATKEDIKLVILDLTRNEVHGKDLKKSINSMNDLVNDGEDPKVAGNIVSQAAHSAQLEGLKGKDLAARVHAAIRQRKQEREILKQKMRETSKKQLQRRRGFPFHGRMRQKDKGRGKGKKGKVW